MSGLARTARLFRQQRRRWINALALTRIGGVLSFRTRISECRRLLGMEIQNKVERTPRGCRSYYRYTGRRLAR